MAVDDSDTKSYLIKMLADLNDTNLSEIENWISSQSYKKDLEKIKTLKPSDRKMKKIAKYIRHLVPMVAELSSEIIQPPTVGDQKDCNEKNCVHIDEFLYDDKQLQCLVRKGGLPRRYCLDCGSKVVEEINIKYYSIPKKALVYIFKVLLPKDLDGKQILNVHSKIGTIIYTAYYYTNAKTIIGLELDKKYCDMQENIINQFSMDTKRITVLDNEIFERIDIINTSDVIILNLEDISDDNILHKNIWSFLKSNVKTGTFIVTNRSVANILNSLGIYEEYVDWLLMCKPCQMENEMFFNMSDIAECDLHLYKVD